jgi:glycosyltransferase involved in cell wall biosynthesis
MLNVPAFVTLRRAIRQFAPDVAVVHNPFPLWSFTVYWALMRSGIPIVHVVHNFRLRCLNGLYFRDGAPCTLCSNGRWWRGVRYACVQGSRMRSFGYGVITQSVWPLGIVRRIAAFRVLSEFSRARLVDMGVPSEQIHVIPNASPSLRAGRRPTAHPTWAFIGHIGLEKGPQVVVEALARGAPGRLIVIGDGPLAADLKRRSADAGLPIEFLGPVDGAERFEILGQAWALVFPSLCFENGPLAVLEAFSLGVPVVASRIGSIPEYVSDGVSGRLFTPGNDADLARVLGELGNDAEQRERLAVGARAMARERFAEHRVAQQLNALIQGAVSVSRASAR